MWAVAELACDAWLAVHMSEHRDRPAYVPSALAVATSLESSIARLDVATAGVIVGRRDPHALVDDAATARLRIARAGGTFGLAWRRTTIRMTSRQGVSVRDFDSLTSCLRLPLQSALARAGRRFRPRRFARATRVVGWLAPTLLEPRELTAKIAALRAESPTTPISGRPALARRRLS